jgi:redox-sensitive bicupin YhaK (pirin superfamily)
MPSRYVERVIGSKPTVEGAGVKLMRAFGGPGLAELFDPFLLLDDFGSRYPHEYLAGFPWHPHRGIETVTYLLKGEVHHEDSTGTKGVIHSGDLQWMTAGSGIFHAEMPKPTLKPRTDGFPSTEVRGFQLWVNLPAEHKMVQPKYRNLERENAPNAVLEDGTEVTLIAGEFKHVPRLGHLVGPVKDLAVDVNYLDVRMPPASSLEFTVHDGYTAFAYLSEGSAQFSKDRVNAESKSVVLFSNEGTAVNAYTKDEPARFLLVSGRPLKEPIAWYGPIVMNTKAELAKALEELNTGEFIKAKATTYDYFTT